MMRRPIIGLNMSMDLIDQSETFGFLVSAEYVNAVTGAGGVPLCVPPYTDITMLDGVLSRLDGFVFIGGDDYRPEHYGGRPQREDDLMPERRDRFDLKLAKKILQKTRLPVLGVCGGHQLISIAQGGALIQDIGTEWSSLENRNPLLHSGKGRRDKEEGHFRHPVRLEKDSLVAQVTMSLWDQALMTNSYHHQAVHPLRVGLHLHPSAWTEDGVIEAIEPAVDSPWAQTRRFVLGVQWHPERMQDEEPHQNVFRALVKAAQEMR